MGIVLLLVTFVVLAAGIGEIGNWISVYWLGLWDPKFGDQRGNIEIGRQALPIFLAVAVASCCGGAWSHRSWLNTRLAKAVSAGAITSVALGLLFWGLVSATRNLNGAAESVSIFIGQLIVFAGPAGTVH